MRAARPNEIVDPTGARQQRRRRRFGRVALPLLGVGSIVVAILLIALHAYEVNRSGAVKLAREVLAGYQAALVERVDDYLQPPVRAAVLVNDMLAHTAADERHIAFTAFAASALRQLDGIEAFTLANDNGDYAVLRRAPGGRSVLASVVPRPDGPVVIVEQYDASGHVTGQQTVSAHGYDPRKRDWFASAVAANGGITWSRPFVTHTTARPVITVAVARRDADGRAHVAAVEVALDALSRFVSGLAVGRGGEAAVVDDQGHLIAAPARAAGVDPETVSLDPGKQPVLTEAFDRARVLGAGARVIKARGVTWITVVTTLPGAAPGWRLLIAAPESDFAGFAVIGGRQNLLLSMVVVALAIGLAGLAGRGARRGDRLAVLLAEVRRRGREESDAIETLVATDGLFDARREAPTLTETVAGLADARRVGVWRLSSDRRRLVCEDQYDRAGDLHGGGFALARDELPRFLALVEALDGPLELGDAAADERTAAFRRVAMAPDTRRLALFPAGRDGVLALEDASSLGAARNLARVVAGVAALRGRAADETADAAEPVGPALEDAAARTSVADLRPLTMAPVAAGEGDGTAAEGAYPATAVMVLQFQDLRQPRAAGRAAVGVADEIVRAVQAIARDHDIPYLKVVNHVLVAAAGCAVAADPVASATRLADTALAIRACCLDAMARAQLEVFFHIGLDVGRVIGRPLGADPPVFNIWGDAVWMAELMAASAPDRGTIQVTEAAQLLLRPRFLLRERGRFFMPRVGVAPCFVLAGRR